VTFILPNHPRTNCRLHFTPEGLLDCPQYPGVHGKSLNEFLPRHLFIKTLGDNIELVDFKKKVLKNGREVFVPHWEPKQYGSLSDFFGWTYETYPF
jgi:hypothetical protein